MEILSTRACQDNRLQELLTEVDNLTGDIFDAQIENRFRFYPRFAVFLSNDHAKAVEKTLDSLIFGKFDGELTNASDSFDPSPQECMYLVAATRLRCIGLLWGLFLDTERHPPESGPASYDNTQPTIPNWIYEGRVDSVQLQNLIETFPLRSSRYLLDDWQLECTWNEHEKGILCSILNSYLPNVSEDCIPERIGDIRIRKLAYLLRLATSCTIGKDVCPLEIRLRMKPGSRCDMRKTHLAPVDWITETIFDHGRSTVEFRAIIPAIQRIPDPRKGSSLPIAYVDYAPALDFLGSVIQEVLNTVSPYLEKCPNTCIQTVKVESFHLAADASKEGQAYLPDHWALPLAAAVNASEVAGMTALVLRSFCTFGFRNDAVSFSEQVAQVCEIIDQMHPCNALIRKLVTKIRQDFSWDREPGKKQITKFKKFLDDYLIARADAGDRVANEAATLNVLIDVGDTQIDQVVVYGYGRSVLSTLIKNRFRGTVLLVDVGQNVRGPWIKQESSRVRDVLDLGDIRYRNVQLASLPIVLRHAKNEGKKFVFLTGARCVVRETNSTDQFLCPVGTWQIASAVNANGGKTVVLVESEKVVTDDVEIADIRNRLNQISAEIDDRPWVQVDRLEDDKDVTIAVIV